MSGRPQIHPQRQTGHLKDRAPVSDTAVPACVSLPMSADDTPETLDFPPVFLIYIPTPDLLSPCRLYPFCILPEDTGTGPHRNTEHRCQLIECRDLFKVRP